MPVWHEATRKWVREGKLVVLGVTQEQHSERCRLFAQWQQFDWPILHDPINVLECRAVPIVVAIDEYGIVRSTRPRIDSFADDFIHASFNDDAASPQPTRYGPHPSPAVAELATAAKQANSADAWRNLGDALILWGGDERLDDAVGAYGKAVELAPRDGRVHFRLGVALRRRYESDLRRDDDFQAAIDCWGQALDCDPNQYIWRRRIQQYGPRLDKPYPFYDWVDEAEQAIRQRGETPVALPVRPNGAEIAHPSRTFQATESAVNPDPDGRISRIDDGAVHVEMTVVPRAIRPGQTGRIHAVFRLNDNANSPVHWNNEAEPFRLWLDPPPSWQLSQRLLRIAPPATAVSTEPRRIEFEVRAPSNASSDGVINGYALFHACDRDGGTCRFVRLDVRFRIPLASR